MTPKFYRLEYNPKDKNLFHLDNYTHRENTSGWETIEEKAENFIAKRFIVYFQKYHQDKIYDIVEVKSMWQLFSGVEN
jgi:hypothetical protein